VIDLVGMTSDVSIIRARQRSRQKRWLDYTHRTPDCRAIDLAISRGLGDYLRLTFDSDPSKIRRAPGAVAILRCIEERLVAANVDTKNHLTTARLRRRLRIKGDDLRRVTL
jgi:hypothetical protein